MPRTSRHKHRQHHRRKDSAEYYYSTDSDNEGSQSQSHSHSHGAAKGGKGKQQDTVKLKSPKQGNKEKSNRGSVVSVSDERWEGGGENALSLLAYLKKDSKADSDSSCKEDNHKTRKHKSKQVGASNGVAEIRVSSRKKETLDKDEGDDSRGKSRVKEDVESGSRKEAAETKKENSSVLVGAQPPPARVLEASTMKESAVAASSQTAIANEEASSQKKGPKSTEWKLQDELRNLELEKELENRILRRREESGDRDRWRDGEREREGKSYSSRDSHQRDDKYKSGKHKEERSRGDRYKDERQEDHKSRTKRYKEEWHKDDIQRTDKYKDDKQRDEKPKEDRHKDARQKDDRHREVEHRDDKCKNDKNKADKNKEGKLEDRCKEDKYREDRYKDEKHRFDSYRDDKSKDEKYQEKLSQECTVDICDSKCSKDESRQRRRFKESNYYDSDQENSSYYNDRNLDRNDSHDKDRRSQKPDVSSLGRSHDFKNSPSEKECRETSRVCEDEVSVQEILPGDTRGSSVVDVAALHNRQKRARDSGPNIGREQKRMKAMEGRSECKDASLEERLSLGRDSQTSKKIEEHCDLPKGLAILSTRATTKRSLDSQRGDSPPGSVNSSLNSSGCLSLLQVRDRSLSPSSRNKKQRLAHEKMTKRKRLEHGFSSPIGQREEMDRSRNSDRCKPHAGREVEVRHRNAGVDLKDSFAPRGRSKSTDRACNTKSENSNIDRFSRAPSVHGGNSRVGGQEEDAPGVDHYSMREGAKTSCHVDEVTSNKSGWSSHTIQNTRSEGFPVQQRTPFPIRPSGHLPPPPPFRPGVDNLSALSRLNSAFEEGPCSRDQGRADWNANAPFNRGDVKGGVRNWNPQAHGPGSSNFYMSFKHQASGLPPASFHNMGQHLGPPLFRGLRPPTDMNHSGVPYHMWENGDRNLSHNGTFGWHRQIEDVCGPPVQGSFNAWDGYVEESAMYGRRDWYQYGQGMGNRGWDRSTGTGKGHRNDTNTDFPHKESEFHGNYNAEESWGGIHDSQEQHKKSKRERSLENNQIKRSDEISPKVITKIPSLSSETKKINKYACDGVKFYLSRLDISQELASPDLYNQCITILGREQNVNSCKANFTTDMPSEDHQLEVNTDAENLISSFDLRRAVFSTLPENHMQRALKLYKKASKQTQNAATVDISANVQTICTTDQIDKSFAAVLGSEEEELCMADNEKPSVDMAVDLKPENSSLQHEYFNPEAKTSQFLDAAPWNNSKRGAEVSETAFKVMDSCDQSKSSYDVNGGEISKQQWGESVLAEIMKPSGKGSDDGKGATVLTGDGNCSFSHLPSVDSCTILGNAENSGLVSCIGNDSIDSKDDLEKLDVKRVEDSGYSSKTWPSKTPTFTCISCARSDSVEFSGVCLRCQGGNQPIAGECHDTPIQQSESLEQTKIFHDEALKSDFVDSKELVSAACTVHILREVSFHVGLPAIRLPHLIEVAIANVS